jgi:tRNA dimethylallyltransferase
VRVAALLGTNVVNCDPAQCYVGFPTLTNQPTAEHDAIAPHELVSIWPLTHDASFVNFSQRAHETIDRLIEHRGVAVCCGGSGLYLHAALTTLADHDAGGAPDHDRAKRIELERRYDVEGAEVLHRELTALDAIVGARTHPNDRPRIIRALEVAQRGESISPGGSSHWDAPLRHETLLRHLRIERDVIHDRINSRTQRMFESGLVNEVASVVGLHGEDADDSLSITARKLHGLSDCIGILEGSLSMSDASHQMATRTRQYAKRQDTWARRWPGMESVEATSGDFDSIAAEIVRQARR